MCGSSAGTRTTASGCASDTAGGEGLTYENEDDQTTNLSENHLDTARTLLLLRGQALGVRLQARLLRDMRTKELSYESKETNIYQWDSINTIATDGRTRETKGQIVRM